LKTPINSPKDIFNKSTWEISIVDLSKEHLETSSPRNSLKLALWGKSLN
jgi:hypothetical protein